MRAFRFLWQQPQRHELLVQATPGTSTYECSNGDLSLAGATPVKCVKRCSSVTCSAYKDSDDLPYQPRTTVTSQATTECADDNDCRDVCCAQCVLRKCFLKLSLAPLPSLSHHVVCCRFPYRTQWR
jgi:hypothetical protein